MVTANLNLNQKKKKPNATHCSVPFLHLQGNAANSSETSMATQPGGSVTSRAASETRSGPPGSSNAGATGNSSGGAAPRVVLRPAPSSATACYS